MKAAGYFALATLALIALSYPLLRMGFPMSSDASALRTSAMLAFVIQIVTFAIARAMARRNLIVGWGIGAYGGRPLLERRGRLFHLSPERLHRADAWFERFGDAAEYSVLALNASE